MMECLIRIHHSDLVTGRDPRLQMICTDLYTQKTYLTVGSWYQFLQKYWHVACIQHICTSRDVLLKSPSECERWCQ